MCGVQDIQKNLVFALNLASKILHKMLADKMLQKGITTPLITGDKDFYPELYDALLLCSQSAIPALRNASQQFRKEACYSMLTSTRSFTFPFMEKTIMAQCTEKFTLIGCVIPKGAGGQGQLLFKHHMDFLPGYFAAGLRLYCASQESICHTIFLEMYRLDKNTDKWRDIPNWRQLFCHANNGDHQPGALSSRQSITPTEKVFFSHNTDAASRPGNSKLTAKFLFNPFTYVEIHSAKEIFDMLPSLPPPTASYPYHAPRPPYPTAVNYMNGPLQTQQTITFQSMHTSYFSSRHNTTPFGSNQYSAPQPSLDFCPPLTGAVRAGIPPMSNPHGTSKYIGKQPVQYYTAPMAQPFQGGLTTTNTLPSNDMHASLKRKRRRGHDEDAEGEEDNSDPSQKKRRY